MDQRVEDEAGDGREQQRLPGGRVEAHPAFVDFFPENASGPPVIAWRAR
jgi:hypothetical protein